MVGSDDRRREIDDEIRAHLDARVEHLVAQGMTPEAARAEATRRFGDVEAGRAALFAQAARQERRRHLVIRFHGLWQDVRYACRGFVRQPALTLGVVATLALGIGANVAMFSVIRATLLTAPPYTDPEHLFHFYSVAPSGDRNSPSLAVFDWIEQDAHPVATLAAEATGEATLAGTGDPEVIAVARVTSAFFDVLDVRAEAGRSTAPTGDLIASRSVVISHGLWQSRFGGDSRVIGRVVRLDGEPWTIAGVMPPGTDRGVQAWLPAPWTAAARASSGRPVRVVGRSAPGVSLSLVEQRLTMSLAAAPRMPGRDLVARAAVVPILDDQRRPIAGGLVALQGVTAFVLLIACANVANLMLAAASARHREFGVRTALGASRGRLIRQLLTEALTLALAGAAAGVTLAFWAVKPLTALAGDSITHAAAVAVRGPELIVAAGLAIGTTLLVSFAPTIGLSQSSFAGLFQGGSRLTTGRSVRLVRQGLVVGQVVLAVTLLCGAGLLIRTFARLMALPIGLETHGVLTAEMPLPARRYATDDLRREFASALIARLASAPGVNRVAMTRALPFSSDMGRTFRVDGSAEDTGSTTHLASVRYRIVSPEFFDTLGIHRVAGRGFAPSDTASSEPVAIVNEQFARAFGSGTTLVERQLVDQASDQRVRVVGVVGDTRHTVLTQPPLPAVYVPMAQAPLTGGGPSSLMVMIKTATDTTPVIPWLRSAVRTLDPELPLARLRPLDDVLGDQTRERRFYLVLLSTFAVIASALAAIGIYGVMTYIAGLRAREISIRLALGARPAHVTALVIRQGLTPLVVGLLGGLISAWLMTGVLTAQLFEISPTDPATLAAAVTAFFAIGVVACWVPAARTATISPAGVLKAE